VGSRVQAHLKVDLEAKHLADHHFEAILTVLRSMAVRSRFVMAHEELLAGQGMRQGLSELLTTAAPPQL
jgi:hypothetical protein